MKSRTYLLSALVAVVLFTACNQDVMNSPNGGQTGSDSILTGYTLMNTGGYTQVSTFIYDALGRLIRIDTGSGQTVNTRAKLDYVGNEIMMTYPRSTKENGYRTDSFHYYLDVNKYIIKTTHHQTTEYTAPQSPEVSSTYDTTISQFDANGNVTASTRYACDSIRPDAASPVNHITKIYSVISNTMNAGNLVTSAQRDSIVDIYRNGAQEQLGVTIQTYTMEMQYDKAYPNKTDFSNPLALSFTGIFLSNGQKLPYLYNKLHVHMTSQQEGGPLLNTYDKTQNFEYAYNANGFVISRTDVATQDKVILQY
jgi:hypothetical protein